MALIDTIRRLLGRSSCAMPAQDSIAGPVVPVRLGRGPDRDPAALATIDESRRRTRTFVRDAAVELETAPVDVPADVQPRIADRSFDGAIRDAKRDRDQE